MLAGTPTPGYETPAESDPATALTGTIIVWARLHGIVSLEVQGRFNGMGHQPATLLRAEMESLADAVALP